jgi:hypothetical protein
MNQPKMPEQKPPVPRVVRYAGDVVFVYAFDVAYAMTRQPLRELLGNR